MNTPQLDTPTCLTQENTTRLFNMFAENLDTMVLKLNYEGSLRDKEDLKAFQEAYFAPFCAKMTNYLSQQIPLEIIEGWVRSIFKQIESQGLILGTHYLKDPQNVEKYLDNQYVVNYLTHLKPYHDKMILEKNLASPIDSALTPTSQKI